MKNQVANLRSLNTFLSLGRVAQALITTSLLLVSCTVVHAVEVNLYTGSAVHKVPIELPPGPGGFAPALSLVYNGSPAKDLLGAGWGIQGVSYIDAEGPKQTGHTGIPGDKFFLTLNGITQELVHAPQSGFLGNLLYRTKQESFLRIRMVTSNPIRWVVTDRSGVKYLFGERNSLATPSILGPSGRTYLTRIIDTHGNEIKYSYKFFTPQGSGGFLYPFSITYGPSQNISAQKMQVFFIWEPTVKFISRVPSFALTSPIIVDRRLRGINILLGGRLVRRYVMGYTNSPATRLQHEVYPQLTSIEVKGADGTTGLPGTTFSYQPGNQSAVLKPKTIGLNVPESLVRPCTRLIDWNRDGFIDVLWGSPGAYKVYLRTGQGQDFMAPIPIPNPASGSLPTLCPSTRHVIKKRGLFFDGGVEVHGSVNSGGGGGGGRNGEWRYHNYQEKNIRPTGA